MQGNDQQQENEIGLFEIADIVRAEWHWPASAALLGLLTAGVATFLLPPTYEATAVVQVAQVQGKQVEAPPHAIERIKTGAFQAEAAGSAKLDEWLTSLSRSQKATPFSLNLIKSTQLIELTARAENREEAIKIAESLVAALAKRHEEEARPMIELLKADLTIAQEKLVAAEKAYASVGAAIGASHLSDDRFTQFALLTSIKRDKEAELFAQRQVVNGLKVSLSAPATQPARMVEAIYAAQQPVKPKKRIIVLLGTMGGLVAGLVFVLTRRWWRSRSQA